MQGTIASRCYLPTEGCLGRRCCRSPATGSLAMSLSSICFPAPMPMIRWYQLSTWLAERLPKRLAQALVEWHGSEGILAEQSNRELEAWSERLGQWRIKPAGTEGWRTAEVTLGGIDTSAISSKTFEVKGLPQLRFIGEVLDVTGELGGHNFQWAWSSGVACGQSL
jgi:predicted flavoprotein YhiN